jgi:hypothetical protein
MNELCVATPFSPLVHPITKGRRLNGFVDTAWCRHVAIALPKTYDASVARSAQIKQIGPVRTAIVRGFDLFVDRSTVSASGSFPAFGIPTLQFTWILLKRLPDFDKWLKDVGPNRLQRPQSGQNSSTSQKRFEIGSNIAWKERYDFVGKPLLIPNPFQELRLEGLDFAMPRVGKKQELHTDLSYTGALL